MNSFKNAIIKEMIEGVRNYKFLIITAGILFFAIFDPILVKIMPDILASQAEGVDFSMIMELTQRAALRQYMDDLYQLTSLVFAFGLMGITAGEIKDKYLIMPYCSGLKHKTLVLSKLLVYSISSIVISIFGFYITYYYSGIIFEKQIYKIEIVYRSGFLFGLYFTFLISLIMFFGSIFKKTGITAFASLLVAFILVAISKLLNISKYTPAGLIEEARGLSIYSNINTLISTISTLGIIAILAILTIKRLNSIEIN